MNSASNGQRFWISFKTFQLNYTDPSVALDIETRSEFCSLCFRLEGQDILSFVASKPRPNEEDVAFVIRPLLDVVNYLHGQQIVHLDIRVS